MSNPLNPAISFQKKLYVLLPQLTIIIAIILRLKHYFENRSFWLDESWVALEIVNRNLKEIISHDYLLPNFSRPPTLFLLIEKLLTLLFGTSEMALRLLPLICGIGSFLLFYFLAKKMLSPTGFRLAIGLFAITEPLVYYSAELKQYSSDLFASLCFWLIGLLLLRSRLSWKKTIALIFACTALLWLSYASLFVLASVLLVLITSACMNKDRRSDLLPLFLVSAISSLNILAIYHLSLSQMANNVKIKTMWQEVLWNGNIFSVSFIPWLTQVIKDSILLPGGLSFPWLMLALILGGVLISARRNPWEAAILLLPIGGALFAAAIGHYPFSGRLILFLVPAYFIFLTKGIEWVSTRGHKYRLAILIPLACVIFLKPVIDAVYFSRHTRCKVYNRQVLEFFKNHYHSGDSIFLNNTGQLPFCYYAGVLGVAKKFPQQIYGSLNNDLLPAIKIGKFAMDTEEYFGKKIAFYMYEYQSYDSEGFFERSMVNTLDMAQPVAPDIHSPYPQGRTWLFLSSAHGDDSQEANAVIRGSFDRHGKILLSDDKPGAAIYLYDIR